MRKYLLGCFLVVVTVIVLIFFDKSYNRSRYIISLSYYISVLFNKSSEFRPYKEEQTIINTENNEKTTQVIKRADIINVDDQNNTLVFRGKSGEFSSIISAEDFDQYFMRVMIRDSSKNDRVSWISDTKDSRRLSDYFCKDDFVELVEKDEYVPYLKKNIHVKYYFILNRLESCN